MKNKSTAIFAALALSASALTVVSMSPAANAAGGIL